MLTSRSGFFNRIKPDKIRLILFLILILAIFFRLYGLDWDQGQHLHPDERFLTMVLSAMKIPKNIGDYLNPKVSTMNPYNIGYGFFVYGTFPLNLTKIIGVITNNNDYGTIHIVGRILSAFFDVGVVFLLFKIGQRILNEKIGLLAAFLYSFMVLPIQLSHFFAVDTFLNFFLVLSFYLLISLLTFRFSTRFSSLTSHLQLSAALGAAFGLALACKISAVLFLPIIGLSFLFYLLKSKNLKNFVLCSVCFVLCTYGTFRFNQPQAFVNGNFFDLHPNPQFIKNFQELRSQGTPDSTFPPAVQWISTKPIIFPLKNMVLWGLGLPLGAISLISVFYSVAQLVNQLIIQLKKNLNILMFSSRRNPLPRVYLNILIIFWVVFLFIYQGIQFAKTIRYFLFIYPFLALLSAQFIYEISKLLKKKIPSYFCFLFSVFCLLVLIYPLSFINIYTKPITRVSASEWIYQNIPAGSTLLNEEWDDGLPLPLLNHNFGIYKGKSVFMYDWDTPGKWQRIKPVIDSVDYIIITSNRAYGSTMSLPKRYPKTIEYYQSLFTSSGDFEKVAEFTSYSCFPPGKYNLFCLNDDSSEESFTVYDHPKVMIFKRKI